MIIPNIRQMLAILPSAFLTPRTTRFCLLLACLALLSYRSLAQTPCDCTNCPQFMPDGFTGNFFIQVQNASNPTLGQNGQGVCGVHLTFDHEYLGDLQITLTSPSGQSVTLIGPIGLFGPTDFTTWDINFVPCGDPAIPDPGFNNAWSNNQAWGMFGSYFGSYYPNNGCLENFNSGPVNGQWTLTVVDGQAVDVGNFTNYEIIFCDPTGIDCFSCAANAGNLTQPDVIACEGSTNLVLNLPPTYTVNSPAPPAGEYEYTYIISGTGGVIQALDPAPDLSTYPAGTYSVCGLSYLATQAAQLPTPDGVLTVTQLTTQLNSSQPPFCGDVTLNCVNIIINPIPENIEEDQTVCSPTCTVFYNQTYCQTGTYVRNLTQNGCPYTATLNLTANQPKTVFLNETICDGGCSTNPSFPTACSSGTYQETLQTVAGCDSNVILNVTILSVNAVIAPPPTLSCGQTTAQLFGTGSTTGVGTSYFWTPSNGGTVTGSPTSIITNIGSAGDYQLLVCRTFMGATCCDSASATVTINNNPPAAPGLISGGPGVCFGQSATFSIVAVAGASSYTWTVPPGVVINSGQNTNTITVTWNSPNGGNICVAANNACGSSAANCLSITVNTLATPTQPIGTATVCAGATEVYQVPIIPNATTYNWSVTAPATIVSGQGTNQIVVTWGNAGNATVCLGTTNTCGTTQPVCLPVTVNAIPTTPVINGNATPCAGISQTYTVPAIPGASIYNWTITGGSITSGNGTNTVQVLWFDNIPSGNLCVTALNSCGSSTQTCYAVTISPSLPLPIITGDAQVCTGTNGAYSITTIAGASGYTWTVPAGAVITAGQNTSSITVNWLTAPGGNVCVATNSACGTGPQQCFAVTVNTQPNANAGADVTLCGTMTPLIALQSVPGSTGAWSTISGPAGASFSNASNDTTDVTAAQNGSYLFLWTEQNGFCSDQDTVNVDFNANPTAGLLIPDCDATNQNYAISFQIVNGTAPFTIPGGTVTGNTFLSNAIVSGQPYTYIITDANGCISQAITGTTNCNCATNAGQMNLAPISTCQGTTLTVIQQGGQNLDGNDVGAYVLHTNSGPSLGFVYDQNTTGIFAFQPGMIYGTTYYVSYVVGNNLAGFPDPADPCLSVAQGQPVVFYQNPVPDAGLDQNGCGLAIDVNGSIGTGSWSVVSTPAGGTASFVNPQSAVTTVNTNILGNYTVRWTIDNNGCTGSDDMVLTFQETPAAGILIESCDGANENYNVTIPISGGQAPYVVNGINVVGSTFVSPFIANGTPFDFTIVDANGCISATITGNYNCNCATNAGQMDLQTLTACQGDSVTAQFLGGANLDANDTTLFVLHTGAGTSLGAIIAQNTSGTFQFLPGMTYGFTYYISNVAGSKLNGALDLNDLCLSVAQGQPVVFYQNPLAVAGSDNQTCGSTIALNASGSGTWAYVSGPAGASTNFTDAQIGATNLTVSIPGLYTLDWNVTLNGCAANDQVTMEFYPEPSLGNLNRTCDPTNENYTVELTISGGTAPISVNGVQIVDSIFTSLPIATGQPYSFQAVDANGCTMPTFAGSFVCNCGTNAGTLSNQLLEACEGNTVTAQNNNDQILDGNDVFVYVLHDGAGAALGQVFSQNTTGVFQFLSGMVYEKTYYISIVAGSVLNGTPNSADPCLSVAVGQPVVFHKNPSPSVGPNTAICGQNLTLQGINSGFAGNWEVIAGPGGVVFADSSKSNSAASTNTYGTYTFRWVENNNGCIAADTLEATFNEIPAAMALDEACNSTNTQYTISFTATGGTAPFIVVGVPGTFTGLNFTSALLTDSSSYSFVLTDNNGCATPAITGIKNCNCTTDAGNILTTAAVFCADAPAVASWDGNLVLDGDDQIEFVLHTLPGSTLGNILAINSQPSFNYSIGLQYGVTYYISAVAGNFNNGVIDLNDPCLSVTPGAPVKWKPLPTVNITGDTSICAGAAVPIKYKGTGTYPLTLQYTSSQGGPSTLTINSQQALSFLITPDSSLTYTFLSVSDGTAPTCTSTLSQTIGIQVSKPLSAGIANDPLALCADADLPIQLVNLITGADFGGTWTDVSTVPVQGGQFNQATGTFQTGGQIPGTYQFTYFVDAQAPCPDKSSTVTVELQALPNADAGEDKTLNCNQSMATLGGPGTTSGSDYNWLSNNLSVGTDPNLITSNPGAYTLIVSTPAGCTAEDVVEVLLDAELPYAKKISHLDISCFGDKNGRIVVDSIVSNHPPVLISLNNGPFGTATDFYPLTVGKYLITLQDANGCEWQSDTIKIGQPPLLTASLGADLTISLGDTAKILANVSVPLSAVDTVYWTPLLDTLNAGTYYQAFVPFLTKQITMRVVDTNGCAVSDRVTITVKQTQNVYVPNIIKPESDVNNVLTVFGGPEVQTIESLQIYDRWGEKIYESFDFPPNSQSISWDGKIKGVYAPTGVYVYYAMVRFINGEKLLFEGDVTILR